MFIDTALRADFERAFSCRVIAWNEPVDDEGRARFEVRSVEGRIIIADTLGLLACELAGEAPYAMAA